MKRIKNLIDQVGLPLPSQKPKEEVQSQYTGKRNGPGVKEPFNNPMADREAIQLIENIYYGSDEDTSDFELKKLPSSPSKELVNEMRASLHIQLNAVSKKLSGVILENQPAYQKELQRVRELKKTLQDAFATCRSGKNYILSATGTSNLRLLVNVQRRRNLLALQQALDTIKTLEHTDVRLRELLEDGDYPEAIQLCLECQKAAITYKQYSCIKDLSSKLQDTIELIEEQIDVALSKTCNFFHKELYEKLQTSYKLLGKPQTAVDQLLMHFTSCVHNTAFQTVLGHVKLCTAETQSNLQKMQFTTLCSSIDASIYIPTLIALCKGLWNIMNCYHKVSQWHSNEFAALEDGESCEVGYDYRYIQQKLRHGRHRVWLDVQSRVKVFLLGTDLSSFKYDEFIKVLDIVKKLVSIGENFCQHEEKTMNEQQDATNTFVQNLQEPVSHQSLQYFRNYHQKCMDELHMFLDNEAWESCPMKANFSLLQLPEFDFLLEANYVSIIKSPFSGKNDDNSAPGQVSFFGIPRKDTHPFSEFESQNEVSDAKNKVWSAAYEEGSDNEVAEELLQDYVDEETDIRQHAGYAIPCNKAKKVKGPILTNTALNILRICGKYLKMCDVLKPISIDVIICMSHLFDYYLFSVYKCFVGEDPDAPICSEKLSAALSRIGSELVYQDKLNNSWGGNGGEYARVPLASLSPIIDLHSKGNLFGFSHRVTAAESLLNLGKQFEKIKPNLEKLIPSGKQAFLHQFYTQTISTCAEVRSHVFFAVAAQSIDYASVLTKMALVKWDIKDIMSQHSDYVDELVHQFERLQLCCNSAQKGLSHEIGEVIWTHCIILAHKTLVEGYSNVKKCSNEGRALMQLDFQQFLIKIEEVTKLRPVPGKELVEGYIKAFYLTEEDLELWMKNHPEYTEKQLSALINSSGSSTIGNTNRKNKQRMLSLIDDLTNRK